MTCSQAEHDAGALPLAAYKLQMRYHLEPPQGSHKQDRSLAANSVQALGWRGAATRAHSSTTADMA